VTGHTYTEFKRRNYYDVANICQALPWALPLVPWGMARQSWQSWLATSFNAGMVPTRSDPLYHKKLRGQIAPKPRFVKMVDLRGY
jgi:hypothetical protein